MHRRTDVLGTLTAALRFLARTPGALLAAGLEPPVVAGAGLGVPGRLALVLGAPLAVALQEFEAPVLVLDETTAGLRDVAELTGYVAVVVRAAPRLDAVPGPLAVRGALHVPTVRRVVRRACLDEARRAVHEVRDGADPGHAVEALAALVAEATLGFLALAPPALVVAGDDTPSIATAAVRVEGAGLALSCSRAISRARPAVLGGALAGAVAADRRRAGPVRAEEPLVAEAAGPATLVGAAVLTLARGPDALALLALVAAAGLERAVHPAEAAAAIGAADLAAAVHQGIHACAVLTAGLALIRRLLPITAAVLPPNLGVGLARGLEMRLAAHAADTLLVLRLVAAVGPAGEPVGVLKGTIIDADVVTAAVRLAGAVPALDLGAACDGAALLPRAEVCLDADTEDRVTGGPAGALAAGLVADPFATLLAIAGVVVDASAVDAVLLAGIAEAAGSAAAVGATGLPVAAVEDAGANLTVLLAGAETALPAAAVVAALQALAGGIATLGLEAGRARRALAVGRAALTGFAVGVITDAVPTAPVAILGAGQARLAMGRFTDIVSATLPAIRGAGLTVFAVNRVTVPVPAERDTGAFDALRPGHAGALAGAVLIVVGVLRRIALGTDAVVIAGVTAWGEEQPGHQEEAHEGPMKHGASHFHLRRDDRQSVRQRFTMRIL